MRKSEGQRIPEKEIANFQFIKLNNTYITETDRSSVSVIFMPFSVLQVHLRSGEGLYISLFRFQTVRCPLSDADKRRNLLWNCAVEVLQTLVIALGAGLGIWGAINLLEGYGNDNPGANAHVR